MCSGGGCGLVAETRCFAVVLAGLSLRFDVITIQVPKNMCVSVGAIKKTLCSKIVLFEGAS